MEDLKDSLLPVPSGECEIKLWQTMSVILRGYCQGFESSESCEKWLETLSRRGYWVRQFLLTPLQVGAL
jgi:hypothetical protein